MTAQNLNIYLSIIYIKFFSLNIILAYSGLRWGCIDGSIGGHVSLICSMVIPLCSCPPHSALALYPTSLNMVSSRILTLPCQISWLDFPMIVLTFNCSLNFVFPCSLLSPCNCPTLFYLLLSLVLT